MTPTTPTAIDETARYVVFAKDQPEYLPLPAMVFPDGRVLTEWTLSEEERERVARGESLRLWIWKGLTHTCPRCDLVMPSLLQPTLVEITSEDVP